MLNSRFGFRIAASARRQVPLVRQRPIRAATEPRTPRWRLYARGEAANFNLTDDVRGEADRETRFLVLCRARLRRSQQFSLNILKGRRPDGHHRRTLSLPGKTQSFATGASISVSAAVVHRTDLLSRSLGQFVGSRQKPLQAQTSQQNVGRNGKRIVTTV